MTLDEWIAEMDFWKSDESDWEGTWRTLREAGLSDNVIAELLTQIVRRAASEYGD